MLMAISQFIKALFMITLTCTLQIVWSTVSRQPVVDQSQPISNQFSNLYPINRPQVTDRSPIFSDSCRRLVADFDLQLKNAVLIAQWLHWSQLYFSRKAVADRLQYMCDRGLAPPTPDCQTTTRPHTATSQRITGPTTNQHPSRRPTSCKPWEQQQLKQ